MNIFFARHGESRDNAGHPDAGNDSELTARGLLQAELLGERLLSVRFDAVFSSSLLRAVQTAQGIVSKRGHCPVHLFGALVETGTMPGYPGLPLEVLQGHCPGALPYRGDMHLINLEKENRDGYFKRASRAIKMLREDFAGAENLLVVAHGGVNRYLISAALELEAYTPFIISQENTALSCVRHSKNDRGESEIRLLFSNDTSHLFNAAQAGKYAPNGGEHA